MELRRAPKVKVNAARFTWYIATAILYYVLLENYLEANQYLQLLVTISSLL